MRPSLSAGTASRELRVGVVGATGLFAPTYLNAARDVAGLRLCAIAARDRRRLESVADAYSHPDIYMDWRQLVKRDDLDLIAVVTPNSTHMEISLAASATGKHVICEKPLATSANDARRMYESGRAADRTHVVAHFLRFVPAIQEIQRLHRAGELGEITALYGRLWQVRSANEPLQWWMSARDSPAGSIGTLGVHYIDFVRFLTGSEVRRVFADLPIVVPERPDAGPISRREAAERAAEFASDQTLATAPVTASDFGTVHGETMTGARFTFTAAQAPFARIGPVPFFEVHGTRASAFVHFNWANTSMSRLSIARHASDQALDVTLPAFSDGWESNAWMFEHFVLPGILSPSVLDRSQLPTFYDGWKTIEILDAALRSHASGRWENVADDSSRP